MPVQKEGADVEPRHAAPFAKLASQWRNSTRAATAVLSSTDGRWAMVSTSVTALVAGSIAWLAAGTIPMDMSRPSRERSLMPYELFLRLANKGNANANYASFAPMGSSQQVSPVSTGNSTQLDYSLATERSGATEDNGVETRTITMDPGDTLVGALTDAGVSDDDANAAVVALTKAYNVRSLRAGQSFDLTFEHASPQPLKAQAPAPQRNHVAQITYTPPPGADDADDLSDNTVTDAPVVPAGKLLSVSFSPSVEHQVTIARATNGSFTAQDQVKELTEKVHRAGATIDSSLYLAAMQAGIPAEVVVQMIHMFSYEVDFQRDLKPGNSFEVLYSYYYTPDGQAAKQGDIKYAAMKIGGRTIALYRFDPKGPDGPDYFDAKGASGKSMLMKTPVDGARITSGFGMRFHPVLGYTRMHKGIDFGVPVGTPVMAAGAGTVVLEGAMGGYGNFLKISHGGEWATGYGHLSRFAPGIHKGSHVHQGQVVAYSGNTGITTGPHLHYEIFKDGSQVNPTQVKIATGRRLFGHDLTAFQSARQHVLNEMAAMPLESKVAESGNDLRAAKD